MHEFVYLEERFFCHYGEKKKKQSYFTNYTTKEISYSEEVHIKLLSHKRILKECE